VRLTSHARRITEDRYAASPDIGLLRKAPQLFAHLANLPYWRAEEQVGEDALFGFSAIAAAAARARPGAGRGAIEVLREGQGRIPEPYRIMTRKQVGLTRAAGKEFRPEERP
jgi:hypothetical protein